MVSREECEAILAKREQSAATTDLEKRLARAHLALLDECENLRRDKERWDKVQSRHWSLFCLSTQSWQVNNGFSDSDYPEAATAREAIDAAISENAAREGK